MISDDDLDAEMVRRGLVRPVAGGFEGDTTRHWLAPTTTPEIHCLEREAIRRELEGVRSRNNASRAGSARWAEESGVVVLAIRQAAVEYGRSLRSKANASRILKDRVNAILEGQGIAPRSERTLRKHIPDDLF